MSTGAPRVEMNGRGVAVNVVANDVAGEIEWSTPDEIVRRIATHKAIDPYSLAQSRAYYSQWITTLSNTANLDNLVEPGVYTFTTGTENYTVFVANGEGTNYTYSQLRIDSQGVVSSRLIVSATKTTFANVEWQYLKFDATELLEQLTQLDTKLTNEINARETAINDTTEYINTIRDALQASIDNETELREAAISLLDTRVTNLETKVEDLDGLEESVNEIKTELEKLTNLVEKPTSQVLWVNSLSTETTENGSEYYPYKTIGAAIESGATFGYDILVIPGSYTENITIDTETNINLVVFGDVQGQYRVKVTGDLNIVDPAKRIGIVGFEFTGDLNIASTSGLIYVQNCDFGTITTTESSAGYIYFQNSFAERGVTLNGAVLAEFNQFQFEAGSLTVNTSPLATSMVMLENCKQVNLIHTMGNVLSAGYTQYRAIEGNEYGIVSTANENEGTLNLLGGVCFNGTQYAPIEKTGTCPYVFGGQFSYEPTLSTLTGTRIDSGLHSDQVYDHKARTGYTKVDDSLSGHLDGISNKFDSIVSGTTGDYVPVADDINANTYYTDTTKLYVTGTTLENFPIQAPFFFDVSVTSDNSAVIQMINSVIEGENYTRVGLISDGNVEYFEWVKTQKEGYDVNQLKFDVLSPIRLENANTDINNAIHLNGYYYIRNTAIQNLPVQKFGIAQILSDTSSDRTFQHFISQDFEVFYRSSTSTVQLTAGNQFYRATATTGSKSVQEALVLSAQANGNLTFRPQLGNGVNFSVNESSNSGIAFSARVLFNIADEEYKTNGFTITFSDDSGGVSDTMELTVNTDGTITPITDTLTLSNSYIRYQSGSMDLSAENGTSAEIYLTVTWSNYTGTLTWTDWVNPDMRDLAINTVAVNVDTILTTSDIYLASAEHTNLPTIAYDGGTTISGFLETKVGTLADASKVIKQVFTLDTTGNSNILFIRTGTITSAGVATFTEWDNVTSIYVEG